MKTTHYFILCLLMLIGIPMNAQENNNYKVTVEDVSGSNNDYMSHPDYGKNRQRYLALSRSIDEEFSKLGATFNNDIKNPGFSRGSDGKYSNEKLKTFISQAEGFKESLKSNNELGTMCSEYTSLIDKVRPGDVNQCETLMEQQLKRIDASIQRAKDLLKNG